MHYLVAWTSDFDDLREETSNFFYGIDDRHYSYFPSYIKAKSNIDAAYKFLSKEYDTIDFDNGDWADETYNYMMEMFIRYSTYGDSMLDQYVNENDINNLITEIRDYYLQCCIMDGKVCIHINQDEYSYDSPGDDDKYICKVQEKYCYEKLIKLLTEEEKKELFIRANLNQIMVISLKTL